MANKVIQLKDKNNTDNLYPLAGGMATDSITTAMLKDGAVTSHKIDFTTLTESYEISNLPAHSVGVNTYILTRVGNIVIMNIGQIWVDAGLATGSWNTIGNIPTTIAPTTELRTVGRLNNSAGQAISDAIWRMTTSGVVQFAPSSAGTSTTNGAIGATFVWTL